MQKWREGNGGGGFPGAERGGVLGPGAGCCVPRNSDTVVPDSDVRKEAGRP